MSSRNNTGPSAAAAAAALARAQQAAVSCAIVTPPGFELLYFTERLNLGSPFDAFVLPVHWSLIRGGLRIRETDSNPSTDTLPPAEISEMLPPTWQGRVSRRLEEGSNQQLKQLVLRYWDPTNARVHYEARILEVVQNQTIVIILFRAVNGVGPDGNVQAVNQIDMNSDSPTRNSAACNFQMSDYINMGAWSAPLGNKRWFEVYQNLKLFEKAVWEGLMDPLQVAVGSRAQDPYQNQSARRQDEPQQQQQQQQPLPYFLPSPQPTPIYSGGGIGGPLYNPPPVPVGGGALGRSDLDPLGGFGAGNVADPRGFRAPPALPYGAGGTVGGTPGARFDPFGPPNPVPPGVPQRPGTGGPNWGVPNPDGEQPPPGFEDMFM